MKKIEQINKVNFSNFSVNLIQNQFLTFVSELKPSIFFFIQWNNIGEKKLIFLLCQWKSNIYSVITTDLIVQVHKAYQNEHKSED